jgi:hypothetical protein
MVQSGTRQEVLDKAAAADTDAKKLHEKKDADGQSVHAVKMGNTLHEEKNAAGQSVRAVKIISKRKFSAWADESKANFE